MIVIPIGGCGEFGRNATACAAGDDAVLIDCGMQMPDDRSPGVDHYVPDLRGLLGHHRPQALLLTHGHEDHIGAIAHLLRTLALDGPLPIYGRPLTLSLVRGALDEARLPRRLFDLRPLPMTEDLAVGALRVRALDVPHSIPEASALLLRGPDERGRERVVLHTGDLKLDDSPGSLAALPSGGVDLLLGDSTNAGRPGRSGSESIVADALADLCAAAPGRLVVALFSSHIARVAHFAESCARAGRRLHILGRGLKEALAAAADAAVLRLPQTLLCDDEEAAQLPPRQIAVLCTGTQGEPEAALCRLAALLGDGVDGPDGSRAALPGVGRLRLGAGDTVVLSARPIPGRELPLIRLTARLLGAGLQVLTGAPYAVSGHACQDEISEILSHVRPRALLPVHGGISQLLSHGQLAETRGVAALRGRDGDIICVSEEITRRGRIAVGRLAVEGKTTGQVSEETISQRLRLARGGLVIAAGQPLSVHSIGVCDEGPALTALCLEAAARGRAAIADGGWAAAGAAERVRRAVRLVFRTARGVRPNVLVVPPADLI